MLRGFAEPPGSLGRFRPGQKEPGKKTAPSGQVPGFLNEVSQDGFLYLKADGQPRPAHGEGFRRFPPDGKFSSIPQGIEQAQVTHDGILAHSMRAENQSSFARYYARYRVLPGQAPCQVFRGFISE